MKALKVVLGIIVVLGVLVVGAGYFLSSNLNQLVKEVVEQAGTEALKTEVSLTGVDINLKEGRAELSGLSIANPAPFSEPTLFSMDQVIVDLELEGLLEKVIDIKEITITGTDIVAEEKGALTNIQVLMDNVNASGGGKSAEKPAGSTTTDVLIKIASFNLGDSAVKLVSEQLGEQAFTMPEIKLTRLGGDTGVPPEAMAEAIFKPLLRQLNRGLEDKMKDIVKDRVKGKLRGKEDKLKSKLSEKLVEELGQEDADKTVDSLKSLLKKK